MQPFFDELEQMAQPLDDNGKRAVEMLKASVRNRQIEMDQAIEDFNQAMYLVDAIEDYEIAGSYGDGYVTIEIGVTDLAALADIVMEARR